MADQNDQQPKIFVDDDWKETARREKEEADRQSREQATEGQGGLPAPQLAEIVEMLILQASVGLGAMQDPQTGQPIPPQLPVAKHFIELLELLQAKTAGNLTPEEQQMIDQTLQQLRMAFVQVAGVGQGGAPGDQDQPGGDDA